MFIAGIAVFFEFKVIFLGACCVGSSVQALFSIFDGLIGPKYFRLIIDEFNSNRTNNYEIGLERGQTKLSLPCPFQIACLRPWP